MELSPQEHDAFVTELLVVLKNHDPIDLISIGCPDDEYHAEAQNIALGLQVGTCDCETHVTQLVHTIFVSMFDARMAGSIDNYVEIGKDVWELWRLAEARHLPLRRRADD